MEENNQNSDPSRDAEKSGADAPAPNDADAAPGEAAVPETYASFGEWLKGQRVQRKVSLEEVAAVTKVHIMQLKALEDNQVSKLPAAAFVRGFLVSYARHLGLDEDDVLDRYKHSFGGSLTPIADLLMPTSSRAARSASAPKVAVVSSPHMREAPSTRTVDANKRPAFSMRTVGIMIGVLAAIGLVVTLITIGKRSKTPDSATETAEVTEGTPPASEATPATTAAPPVSATGAVTAPPPAVVATPPAAVATPPTAPASAAVTPAPAKAPETPKAADTAAADASAMVGKKYQLEIKALDGNYVHLRVDDASPKGITLKAAQTHLAGVDRKAVLTISDAGNIEIRWNGTWYAAPGFRGDLKVITLPDQLSQLTAKGATAAKPKAKAAAPLPPAAGAE